MTRKDALALVPTLIVGVAIVVSTFIMVRTRHSAWQGLAGPLLLASSVVVADVLTLRLRGDYSGPTRAGLTAAVAIAISGLVLIGMNVKTADMFIPLCWIAVMPRGRRRVCGNF
jgi:uncharacterized membrane protein